MKGTCTKLICLFVLYLLWFPAQNSWGQAISTVAGVIETAAVVPGVPTGTLINANGVTVAAGGVFYIADTDYHRILKISGSTVTTIAGQPGVADYYGDGDPATAAAIDYPYDIAIKSNGDIYFTEFGGGRIRKIGTDGIISTVASGLLSPTGIAVSEADEIYFTENYSFGKISKLSADDATLTVVATDLAGPAGIALKGAGPNPDIYFTESESGVNRVMKISGGVTTTLVDTGAGLNYPTGIALDVHGSVYVADVGNRRVIKVNALGQIGLVAGSSTATDLGDGGAAPQAKLTSPFGLDVDGEGNIYIADNYSGKLVFGSPSGLIRRVEGFTNRILTVAEGGVVDVSTAYLYFRNTDQESADITYTIKSASLNGTLYKNGNLDPNPNTGEALAVGDTFTQADIEAGLIKYKHDGTENLSASFGFDVLDTNGNGKTAQTFNFAVTGVNDAPYYTDFGDATITFAEDTQLTITNPLVFDPEASIKNANIRLTLTATSGKFTVAAITGGASVGGNNSSSVILGGKVAAINKTLADGGVKYTPNTHYNGTDKVEFLLSDLNTQPIGGSGPALTADTFTNLVITPVNDAPVITAVTSSFTVTEDESKAITGVSVADLDVAAGTVAVNLKVTSGKITVAATTGVTITTNETAEVKLEGTLADVNTALATISYLTNLNFNGSDALVINMVDNGNTGSGGSLPAAPVTIALNINAVNDAPTVATVTSSFNIDEDVSKTITGVSVADLDAGTGSVEVKLKVTSGKITVAATTGVTIATNGTAEVKLTGKVADINAALATISYLSNNHFNGSDELVIDINDKANTGSGGEQTASASVDLIIDAVNDVPTVATVTPSFTVNEDVSKTITGVSVADLDAGTGSVEVKLKVTSGTITVATTTGVTIATNGTAEVTLTGKVADVNTALATISYLSNNHFSGSDELVIDINDKANTGSGGEQTASASVDLIIDAVNDQPTVATVTPSFNIDEDVSKTITGVSVADLDAGTGSVEVKLKVTSGKITVAATTGVTIATNGTAEVKLTGKVADVNAALATISYLSNNHFNGSDELVIDINDKANTGSGGEQTASASVDLIIDAVNDAPVIAALSPSFTVNEDESKAITGVSVSDVDVAAGTVAVNLKVTSGKITVAATTGVTITTNETAEVKLEGKLADVNAALATISYLTNLNFNGSDALVLNMVDNGNTGSGGSLPAAPVSIALNINEVNDAPSVATLTSSFNIDEDVSKTITGVSVADLDAGTGSVEVKLKVTSGKITVAATTGVTIATNGTAEVKLTGKVADINAALATISYLSNNHFNGSDELVIDINDKANTGSGGEQTASASIDLTIDAVNDAPVIAALSPSFTVNEDESKAITGVSVSDVDVAAGTVAVNLKVTSGKITVAATTGVTITTNETAEVKLEGKLADVNAALATISYLTNLNFNGSDVLVLNMVDNGNTGSGGSLPAAPVSIALNINEVNDAPSVATVTSSFNIDEDVSKTITGVSVADLDAGTGSVEVKLKVTSGKITVAATTGVTIATNGTAEVKLTGKVADINTALATISYLTNLNFNGSDELIIDINDKANTGSGGEQTASASVDLIIDAVNDVPTVATATPSFTVNEDVSKSITGVSVADLDAGTGSVEVKLKVTSGKITVAATTGVTIATNGTAVVTLTGKVADVNTALATISYLTNTDFNGSDELVIDINDKANTGSGGEQTASASVDLTIDAVNDAPVIAAITPSFTVNEDESKAITGVSVSDVDVAAGTVAVNLKVTSGKITVAATTGVTITTNETAEVKLEGKLADVNAALATISYLTNLNFNGSDALVLNMVDNGNTGSGGSLPAAPVSIALNINEVNDAPSVATVTSSFNIDEDVSKTITGVSVADLDAGTGSVEVKLKVTSGKITVAATTGVIIATNGTAEVKLTGKVADINAALATISYLSNNHFNGSDELVIDINDKANTGSGGEQTASASVDLIIDAVNDQPTVATVTPSFNVDEDVSKTITGVSVADLDAGTGSVEVKLKVTSGKITVATTTGVTIATNGTAEVKLTGKVADVNTALATISYLSNNHFNGSDELIIDINDKANTGSGGEQTASASVDLIIDAVNDVPTVATVTPSFTVNEDVSKAITGVSVADLDAGTGSVEVKLKVTSGKITVAATTGVTIATNGTAEVKLTGKVADINTALSTISYLTNTDFNGSDELVIDINDKANTGSGGEQTGSASVDLTIDAVNDVPVIAALSPSFTVNEDESKAITGVSVSDVDVAAGTVAVNLKVTSGKITVATTTGVTITTNETAEVKLEGKLADVNAALATISYLTNLNFNGSDVLVLNMVDNGNTGSGGSLPAAPVTIALNINEVNDAPSVATVTSSFNIDEDVSKTITGVSVADLDAGTGSVEVKLKVTSGKINVAATTGVAIATNGTAVVTLTGKVADINTALATISYLSNNHFNGSDELVIDINDKANTGSGGEQTASASVDLIIDAVNDQPTVATVTPSFIIDEDVSKTITGVSVADLDAGTGSVEVKLKVTSGTITVATTTGVTIATNGTAEVKLTGKVADVNTALATISYLSNNHFNGSDELVIDINDKANTGSGGEQTASASVDLIIDAVNDQPTVATATPSFTVNEDVSKTITGVSVADLDAGTGSVEVKLKVTSGKITVAATTGVTIATNGTAEVKLTGKVADVNAALATISYLSNNHFNGSDELVIDINDKANTGSGGEQTASASIDLTIDAVNDAPVIAALSPSFTVNEDESKAITGVSVSDVDVAAGTVAVNLKVTSGKITVAATTGVTITTNETAEVKLEGKLADVNAALATISYLTNLNFNGSDALVLNMVDNGNTGSGGSLPAAPVSIALNINEVNDAPSVATVTSSFNIDEDVSKTITGVSVADLDAGTGSVEVKLKVTSGKITVAATTGVIIATNGTAEVKLTGKVADINAALATISYLSNNHFNGSDELVIDINDKANTGSGGEQTASASVDLIIDAVNDQPTVATATPSFTVNEDVSKTITGVSVADLDAGTGSVEVKLKVTSGKITVAATSGVTIATNGTAVVTLTGKVAHVNTALATISYLTNTDFNGSDELVIDINDKANTGSGGEQTASASVDLTIDAVNDVPVIAALSPSFTVNEDESKAITGVSVGDVDAAAGTVAVKLKVTNGTITVAATTGVTITTNGTAEVKLEGTLADVNAALATISYLTNLNFNASDAMVITMDDNGNTGSGGNKTAAPITITLNIDEVNDAPTIATAITSFDIDEDVRKAITGVTVSDVDAAAGSVAVTLKVTSGTIKLTTTAGLTVTGNDSDEMSLSGTLTNVNAALATLSYLPYNGFNGSDALVINMEDNGNTGSGGNKSATPASITLNIGEVNDAPVITALNTSFTVDEDVRKAISGVSVSDEDAGAGTVAVNLKVTSGKLTVAATTGVTITTNGTAEVKLEGTLADVNVALATLSYITNLDFNASDALVITMDDNGNTGSGGNKTAAPVTITLNIDEVNDAPVITAITSSFTVDEDVRKTITGVSVSDVDAAAGSVAVTLKVTNGKIKVAATTGVTITTNETAEVKLSGKLADINAALATISYLTNLDFNGSDALVITMEDNGNTGSGGNLTAAPVTITLNIDEVNDAPVIAAITPSFTVNEDESKAITGVSVSDVDVAAGTVAVNLKVTSGKLTVAATTGVTITTNGTAEVKLEGTLADVNAALATISYLTNLDFNASDAMVITMEDNGNTGSGGNKSAAPVIITLNIDEVNDAPSIAALTSSFTVDEDVRKAITGVSVSDVDAAAGTVTVKLKVTSGTIKLTTTTGLTLSGNDSDEISLSGTLTNVNAALATLSYITNLDFNASDALVITMEDNGNTGTGGSLAAAPVTITLNIDEVNDAPSIAALTSSFTVDEDVRKAITGVSVGDVDAAAGTVAVKLKVTNGTITVAATTGVTITTNGTAEVKLEGTLADVNAALATISYLTNLNFNASDAMVITMEDNGNTGSGGNKTAPPVTIALNIDEVNDAPTIATAITSFDIDEDVRKAITGVTVSDVDAAAGSVAVTLKVTSGTIKLTTTAGLTVTGNDSDEMSLSGTLTNVNAALATLSYLSGANFNGSDPLVINMEDKGNTGKGGSQSAAPVTIALVINPVNDAPEITSNGGGAVAALSMNEKTTAVTTVTATDVANENSTFTFSLSGGADQDLFSLDAATGLLTFQTAPVYKVGPGADNTYEVKVRATDNGSPNKFDEQILTVSILDITRPSVIVATTATNPTNLNPIPFTVKFSEPVNGFVLADITVVGGTKGAFTGSGTDYSFIIIPAGNGPVTVHVEANKAFDAANNGNTAANDGTSGGTGGSPGGGGPVEIIYDDVKPTVALSSTAAPVINAPFTVTFTFSEDMTGFAASDITVINGTASALTPVSATEYTALISPIASGQVRVSLAANVAADAAGNGNQASGVLTRTYDNQAPAGYAVAFNQSRIDASNQANASVKVTGAEVGSTYFYTIGSDNGGTPVTGSAIAAAAGFNIAPLNLSGLNDGLLTVSFYQQDALGNKGLVVTATVTKLGKEIALVANPALIKVPFRTTYAQLTLPAQVEVTFLSGNKEQVGVSWLPGSYNGMVPGIYTLSGNLVLGPGITNQDSRQAAIQVEVLPNQAPTALMLSNAVFAPDINGLDVTKGLPEAIGVFSTTDADDNLHTYTLVSGTGSTNNSLFEIVDGQLFLKSNKGLYGLKTFEIRVRTTDPYRNTFEQTFIITKGKYLKGTMEIVNAFTPNGDGINDTWVIPELRFYDNVEIEVFDRAGVRLFHTTNPEQGWNGRTRNGQELKGPFLFMLQIKDINFVKKGTVTVLKRD